MVLIVAILKIFFKKLYFINLSKSSSNIFILKEEWAYYCVLLTKINNLRIYYSCSLFEIYRWYVGYRGWVYIVIDNASIHVPEIIDPVITKRGYYTCIFSTYSPELNPIEQFWAIVKRKVKRDTLSGVETLSTRITDASNAVNIFKMLSSIL